MKPLFLLFLLFGCVLADCQEGDEDIRGLCFKFVDQQLSFEEARNYCHRNSFYLAYVPDLVTSNFLASYSHISLNMTSGYVWIGLSKNGTFQWDNGLPLAFTNFGSNNGQNYAGLSVSDGKWYTFLNEEKKNFVCSYDIRMTTTTTTVAPTTKKQPCTPSTRRTFLFAYSTDLSFENVQSTFEYLPGMLNISSIWNTYANVRLDMKDQEEIEYSTDTESYAASLYLHIPDPSLGYRDSTTGSDMFSVIRKFLSTTESLCGSTIYIAAKRYPNEADLEDLITLLQNNHVFVYFVASNSPNGGTNPSAMFNVATRTNGFCAFSIDASIDEFLFFTATEGFTATNQILAQKFLVPRTGSQTIPFKAPDLNLTGSYLVDLIIVFQDHKLDGSLFSLNYTVTDGSGLNLTRNREVQTKYTAYFDDFPVNGDFILKIDYKYGEKQEVMEVRMYTPRFAPDSWLPFNN